MEARVFLLLFLIINLLNSALASYSIAFKLSGTNFVAQGNGRFYVAVYRAGSRLFTTNWIGLDLNFPTVRRLDKVHSNERIEFHVYEDSSDRYYGFAWLDGTLLPSLQPGPLLMNVYERMIGSPHKQQLVMDVIAVVKGSIQEALCSASA